MNCLSIKEMKGPPPPGWGGGNEYILLHKTNKKTLPEVRKPTRKGVSLLRPTNCRISARWVALWSSLAGLVCLVVLGDQRLGLLALKARGWGSRPKAWLLRACWGALICGPGIGQVPSDAHCHQSPFQGSIVLWTSGHSSRNPEADGPPSTP